VFIEDKGMLTCFPSACTPLVFLAACTPFSVFLVICDTKMFVPEV
jgi:hypothetical protein